MDYYVCLSNRRSEFDSRRWDHKGKEMRFKVTATFVWYEPYHESELRHYDNDVEEYKQETIASIKEDGWLEQLQWPLYEFETNSINVEIVE